MIFITPRALMKIAWTRVHAIDAWRSEPTPAICLRHLQKKPPREHSPTRRKQVEFASIYGVAV